MPGHGRLLGKLLVDVHEGDRGHVLNSQDERRQLPAGAVIARAARISLRIEIEHDLRALVLGAIKKTPALRLDAIDHVGTDGIANVDVLAVRNLRAVILT